MTALAYVVTATSPANDTTTFGAYASLADARTAVANHISASGEHPWLRTESERDAYFAVATAEDIIRAHRSSTAVFYDISAQPMPDSVSPRWN